MDLLRIFWMLCFYGILAATSVLITLSLMIYLTTNPYPIEERYKEEESFHDEVRKISVKFPHISEDYSTDLSVVVPAYNEEIRLPPMLDEALEFLERRVDDRTSYKYEIIIVSDGSTDGTVKVAQSYVRKYGSDKVRCLELVRNRGKGGAVKMGVLCSRGATILFADADGASKFEDLAKLEAALGDLVNCSPVMEAQKVSEETAVAVGSRAHLEKESLATRSIFRNILMYGFHFLVWLFTVRGIKDTQCGFKLFTRKAARACFQNLHVHRWAFDVELLYIAQKLSVPVAEVAVRWREVEGSKVTPGLAWAQMGADLALIWLRYALGAWRLRPLHLSCTQN